MSMLKKILKFILLFLGLWLLIGMALVIYGLAGAGARVRGLCEGIKPGISVEAAVAYGKANGFLIPQELPVNRTVLLLAEKRSMGRYGCDIELLDGVVKSVKTYHHD